jgi:hypothetical protein
MRFSGLNKRTPAIKRGRRKIRFGKTSHLSWLDVRLSSYTQLRIFWTEFGKTQRISTIVRPLDSPMPHSQLEL